MRRSSKPKPESLPAAAERLRQLFASVASQIPATDNSLAGPAGELSEMLFSLPDVPTRTLFTSLCRRHGVEPYRFRRRISHEMAVRAPKKTLDRIADEFTTLQNALDETAWALLGHLIEDGLMSDGRDTEERPYHFLT